MAWRGMAGTAWQSVAKQGLAQPGSARHSSVRRGTAGTAGTARLSMALPRQRRRDETRRDEREETEMKRGHPVRLRSVPVEVREACRGALDGGWMLTSAGRGRVRVS